jgi:hypothetical protein
MIDNDFVKQQLEEFVRIKDLNLELLDVLSVTIEWFMDFHRKTQIEIPNIKAISLLIGKTHALLKEIDSPPFLQHRKRTPQDETEPTSHSVIEFVFGDFRLQ